MRRFVAAWIAAVVGTAAAQAAPASAPVLRLVDVAPVILRGAGFAGLERVRVTLTRNGRTHVRRVRSTRAGRFTVGFGLLALEPCRGAIVVRAMGGRGSRATYRRACRPPSIP